MHTIFILVFNLKIVYHFWIVLYDMTHFLSEVIIVLNVNYAKIFFIMKLLLILKDVILIQFNHILFIYFLKIFFLQFSGFISETTDFLIGATLIDSLSDFIIRRHFPWCYILKICRWNIVAFHLYNFSLLQGFLSGKNSIILLWIFAQLRDHFQWLVIVQSFMTFLASVQKEVVKIYVLIFYILVSCAF